MRERRREGKDMTRTLGSGVLIGVGLLVAVLVTYAVVSYRNTTQLYDDAGSVAHTHEVLDVMGDVLRTVVDAETGERGFLITGQEDFLQPYDTALVHLNETLTHLKRLTSDSQRQQD